MSPTRRREDSEARKRRRKVAQADAVTALTGADVWRPSTFRTIELESTAELEDFDGFIEQDRAVRALELGLTIQRRKYNVYVCGLPGTGKTTAVRRLLAQVAPKREVPPDWVYVNDFENMEAPRPLKLKTGGAKLFKEQIEDLVSELAEELPSAFHAKEHQEKIQRVINASMEQETTAFNELSQAAREVGFEVRSTKTGLVTIPVVDGDPVANKDFALLPAKVRQRIEKRRKKLEPKLSAFLEVTRTVQVQAQREISDLQRRLAASVVAPRLVELRREWRRQQTVMKYLEELEEDLIDHLGEFFQEEDQEVTVRKLRARYSVAVMVDHGDTQGAPVVFENNPTYFNLFGKVEKRVEQGIFSTDITMVRPGSVVRAGGGYLVLQTTELFMQPFAWTRLKAVLRNREIAIEDIAEQTTFVPTTGLRPTPIPVDVKVLLIGPPEHYSILCREDPDFQELFGVKAEFDSEVDRNGGTELEVAQFIAATCRNDKLRHCTRDALAALVEAASRMVADQERLTLQFNDIANLLIEADYQAGRGRSRMVRELHVARAIEARKERCGLLEDRIQQAMLDDRILIQTQGEGQGAVNGLAVLGNEDSRFGKPLRISARTFAGKSAIINVEREARLAGRVFNKGVMILSGWLGGEFAQDGPLALTVNLSVEQSYGMIDGDSASCAELYAILSSLADVPLRLDLAVTGSVNQHGDVQAVGGVIEKVEGFFELCRARRLTGRQGVLVPVANVRNLVLRKEVREAVERGRFHIYPVTHVDEGIELLSGLTMKQIRPRVLRRLRAFRDQARRQAPRPKGLSKNT